MRWLFSEGPIMEWVKLSLSFGKDLIFTSKIRTKDTTWLLNPRKTAQTSMELQSRKETKSSFSGSKSLTLRTSFSSELSAIRFYRWLLKVKVQKVTSCNGSSQVPKINSLNLSSQELWRHLLTKVITFTKLNMVSLSLKK